MSFVQQHKLHPSTNTRENKPFFRPSAMQMAKIDKKNSTEQDIHSDFDSGIKLKPSPQQTVQARMTNTPSATSSSVSPQANESAQVDQTKNETGIPEGLRSGLENLSGENLSGVRVHRNSSKPAAIQAHAYAQGQDIHLAPGQEKHLPHEGWHVVQQMQGRVKPTLQKKDALINDDASLEKEADVMGEKASNETTKIQLKKDISSKGQNRINSTIQCTLPTETPTDYKTYVEIAAMTVFELNNYADKQADWHASTHLSIGERDKVRLVLGFAREPDILQGLGGMNVDILHQEMVLKGIANVKNLLRIYTTAVSTQIPFQLSVINAPKDAIKTGENLDLLMKAFPAYILKSAMKEPVFNILQNNNLVADVINYYTTAIPHPLFEAVNGMDFASYNNQIAIDKVDASTFYKAPLIGKIRNYHRFEKAALDQLIINLNDTSKTKPLTLILHTSLDDTGAFHRDPKLTRVITEPTMNTLLIEGKETLADIESQIEPLAKTYGVNDKIDQLMIAGHGEARSMQLAGKVQDDGSGNLEQVKENLDLDNNRIDTDSLMKKVLDNMDGKGVNKKDWQPHRRIIFNACLTNSNAVRAALKATNLVDAQLEIENYIRNNASLATHVQNLAKKNKNHISSVGSNASFAQIDLIDPSNQNLDLIDATGDPQLTSSKIKYVEFGTDPNGAMRAVVECWADNLTTCDAAMKNRIKTSTTKNWEEVIIKSCYEIVIKKYWMNPSAIILFEQVAGILDHMKHEAGCSPSEFRGADTIGSDFTDLMIALKTSTNWSADTFIPLVMYQGWMTSDPADAIVKADFLTHLSTNFTCQSARKFVDIDYLDKNGHLPKLLSTKGDGQMILALLGVLDAKKPIVCENYLISELNSKDRFDAIKGIDAKLDGLATEDQLLIAIGKLIAPSKSKITKTVTTNKDANVLIHGDTKNKVYIDSVTYDGVIKAIPEAEIHTKPDLASGKLNPLKEKQTINVLGEIDTWWAIEYLHGTKAGTAFVDKNDVTIL